MSKLRGQRIFNFCLTRRRSGCRYLACAGSSRRCFNICAQSHRRRQNGLGCSVSLETGSWATVSLRFDVIEEACAYVLGFGPQMAVVEPVELRQMVIHKAEATVAFYNSGAGRPV